MHGARATTVDSAVVKGSWNWLGWRASRRSAPSSFGRCPSKTVLNHPYYDPLWAELERLETTAAAHATPGLWNPEWTSHGPFFEKVKDRLAQPPVPGGGGGPFAGGSGGAGQSITFIGATPLGHPLSPILANWLDNHMFVASTLIGFTVMERYPAMKVVVAHGKASWMQEVLEKMEASTRVIPLLHHYRSAPNRKRCESTATSCSASTPRNG